MINKKFHGKLEKFPRESFYFPARKSVFALNVEHIGNINPEILIITQQNCNVESTTLNKVLKSNFNSYCSA